jgi:diguanylate cyclase (GGDEF)-like protein
MAGRRVGATAAAMAIVAATFGVVAAADGSETFLRWLALTACLIIGERLVVDLELGRDAIRVNATAAIVVFGLIQFGAGEIVLAAGAAAAVATAIARQPANKALFNVVLAAAQIAVFAGLANVFAAGTPTEGSLPSALALLAAVFVTDIVSVLFIAAVSRMGRERFVAALRPITLSLALSALLAAAFGTLAAGVAGHHPWMVVLVALVFAAVGGMLRLFASLTQRFRKVEALYEFAQAMTRSGDVDRAASTTVESAQRALNAGWVELVLAGDAAARTWTRRAGLTTADAAVPQSPAAGAILAGGPAVVTERGAGADDVVAVPLVVADEVTGAVVAHERLGDVARFERDDLAMLEAMAAHAASAIENRRLIERLNAEAVVREHQSRHDALTGLPNRRELVTRLDERLARGESPAVVTFDVRRLRDVNDMFGFEVGDELLLAVAGRLTRLLPADAGLARTGSDEFSAILPVDGAADARMVVDAIQAGFRTPIALDGVDIVVPLRAGIAVPGPHDDAWLVVRHSEQAVALAQEQRIDDPVLFDLEEDSRSARRLSLAVDLRAAIAAGELALWFQPKVRLADGRVVGAEALCRWQHPVFGMVPPAEFIQVAEQAGLIGALTRWAVDAAAAHAATWDDHHGPLSVAVNVSAQDLQTPEFVPTLREALRRHQLAGHRMTLEITETQLMADPEQAVPALARIAELGVGISIDDFGTGYSSLAYLKRLKVRELKIDRSFLVDLTDGGTDAAIARMIVDLGHSLDLTVVAEGVEHDETRQVLARMGCDIAQGYLFARPLPPAQFAAWIRERTGVA